MFEVIEQSIATATLHHHLQQQQEVKKTCTKTIINLSVVNPNPSEGNQKNFFHM
jgi:hypothetical protein